MYNYWATDSSESLEHHGIKGQKWGVKHGPPYPIKYVDSKGNLTSNGKRRKKELAEIAKKTDNKLDMSHPSSINNSTILTRVANKGELLDSKRKYVSLDRDTLTYLDLAEGGHIGTDLDKEYGVYVYKPVKDLKLADYNTVHQYVLDTYGDTTMKEISKRIHTDREGYALFNKLTDNEQLMYMLDNTKWGDIAKDVQKKHLNDITDHFVKEGYDIMADFWDSAAGIPTAMIVLNPEKTLKKEDYIPSKEYWKMAKEKDLV
jgi:hypothetical protein